MEYKDATEKFNGSIEEPKKEASDNSDHTDKETNSKLPESNENTKTDNEKENTNEDKKVSKQGDEAQTEEKNENAEYVISEPEDSNDTLQKISKEVDQFIASILIAAKDDDNVEVAIDVPEFVDRFLDLVEQTITKQESFGIEGKSSWGQEQSEEESSLDLISKLYRSLVSVKLGGNLGSLVINRIGIIQHRAMTYLEDEFRTLMEEFKLIGSSDFERKQEHDNRDHEFESGNGNNQEEQCYPGYPGEVVYCLRKIAKEMIAGGYESECCEVYMLVRRYALDEIMRKLGFEKHGIEDVYRMDSDSLNKEIVSWIKTFKECISTYYPGERKLAQMVFFDNPKISMNLLNNLTRKPILQFLNIVEGVIMTKRSPEKLFKALDVYETLRDMTLKIDDLFVDQERGNEVKTEITTTRCRLGEAAILLFSELEIAIKNDAGRNLVPGGAVHPLTRYTMNYLEYLSAYKETLAQVFKDHSKVERRDSTSRSRYENESSNNYNNNDNNEEQSPVSVHLMRVMDLLDTNLEGKAKLYKDLSLNSIFLMNNGRYILQKIKGCTEIYNLMGENWCRKRSSDLRQYHKNYQRETWGRLLNCLTHEGLSSHGKVMKPVLKERFKAFNAMFDEIHRTQSSWVVSDEQLQSELRVSISAVVIPAYRSFLARFAQILDPGRQTEKYIKYQPEDIESYIDDLFEGKNPMSSMARRML